MSCEGCKWYKQDHSITMAHVMKCMKYNNVYCQRCPEYLMEGEEEVVEVPVDTKRLDIDWSPVGKDDNTPQESKEDKINRLREELKKLEEANESEVGDGS